MRNHDDSRSRIIEATLALLTERGPGGWTLADVARAASCAKGLVNYHFKTKQRLIDLATEEVRTRRAAERIRAASGEGTAALDTLWASLVAEVRTGRFALWLALVGHPSTRGTASEPANALRELTDAVATALSLPVSNPLLGSVPAMLDGLQLLLLQGVAEGEVREYYDRWWLTLLEEP